MRHLNKIVVLVIAFLGWNNAAWADDHKGQSVVLEITTKLDVKAKVKVQASSNNSRMPALDRMTEACVDQVPKLRLALDQGNAVYLIVPLPLLKHVSAADDGHRITLADDSVHLGKILTTITGADGKTYDLATASAIANSTAAKIQAPDPKLQRLTLSIAKQPGAKHEVIRPRIRTERLGADPLTMTFDGTTVQANLSDFDKVVLAKKGKTWQINVTSPGAPEKTGELVMRNGWWFLGCEATNGAVVILRGQLDDRFPDNPGFTLEKLKSASPREK